VVLEEDVAAGVWIESQLGIVASPRPLLGQIANLSPGNFPYPIKRPGCTNRSMLAHGDIFWSAPKNETQNHTPSFV
jgi:hypothetical protein